MKYSNLTDHKSLFRMCEKESFNFFLANEVIIEISMQREVKQRE